MARSIDSLTINDKEPVLARDMTAALTAAPLRFDDGAVQEFAGDGTTVYAEGGVRTSGQWSVLDDGEFSSFWPPSYHANYELRWLVESGQIVGLTFVAVSNGERFNGRYV